MMRRATALICLLLLWDGCGQPVAIYEAPTVDVGKVPDQNLQPCNDQKPCSLGLFCVEGLCRPDNTPDSAAIEQPKDTFTPPPDSNPQDIVQPTPDTKPVTPDPGPQEDPGPPEPPVVQCNQPGSGADCEDVLEVCRINEPDKTLTCSGSVGFGPYKAPCSVHPQCDILFGCHHGVCTTYCQLQFGNAECFPDMPNCKNVGHPAWGACGP